MSENHTERLSVATLRQRMYTLLSGTLARFEADNQSFGVRDADMTTEVVNTMQSMIVKVKGIMVFTMPRQHGFDEYVYLPVDEFKYQRFTKAIDAAVGYLDKPNTSVYVHLVGEDGHAYQIRAIEYDLHRRHYVTSAMPKCSAKINITLEVERTTKYIDYPIEEK